MNNLKLKLRKYSREELLEIGKISHGANLTLHPFVQKGVPFQENSPVDYFKEKKSILQKKKRDGRRKRKLEQLSSRID